MKSIHATVRRTPMLVSRLAVAAVLIASWAVPAPGVEGESFTFVVSGDHFADPPKGMIDEIVSLRPDLVLSTGDLIFRSKPEAFADFKRVILDPLTAVGAEYYPCLGNHDFPIDNWRTFWGKEKGANYYSFEYGNSYFVVLDGNKVQARTDSVYEDGSEEFDILRQSADFHRGSEQHNWLIEDLEKTDKKHLFAFMNHCVFSFGGHEGSELIQRELAPVFEKYRFTAVFSGHSHGYERFKPIRVDLASSAEPRAAIDEEEGITYVVTASGMSRGNLYDIRPSPLHAAFEKAANYVVVAVHGDRVGVEVFEPRQKDLIDSFELKSRR